MSKFTFTDPTTGKLFQVSGGTGLSLTQAQSIFQSQSSAGSLVGLKPGKVLDSASQALGGLGDAKSQLGRLADSAGSLSTSKDALNTLSSVSGLSVTDGIGIADYSLTAPAVAGIEKLDGSQVTALLGQASKATGQSFSDLTETQGLGKYGLSVGQLESAGVVKSGTAAKYLNSSSNLSTDILNSPAVFTGKNGINSAADLLGSPSKQDLLQTSLMDSGIKSLKSQGLPTDLLDAGSLGGTALVAAKGSALASDWLNGGGSLDANTRSQLNSLARDGAFAVGFADSKISDAMAQQFPALPSIGTADRATLNAATGRVVGNEKIPPLTFDVGSLPLPSEIQARLDEIVARFRVLAQDFGFVSQRYNRRRPETIDSDAVGIFTDLEESERILSDLYGVKSELLGIKREAEARDPPAKSVVSQSESVPAASTIAQVETFIGKVTQRIEQLTTR